MDERGRETAVRVARRLPIADVEGLARATAKGLASLRRHRGVVGSAAVRSACQQMERLLDDGAEAGVLAGVLLGAGDAWHASSSHVSVEVAWTGPASTVTTSRLTAAALIGILREAREEILLIGYAVQTEPTVAEALQAAAERGVAVTLVLERQADNPHFVGGSSAFPELPARRLAWPADQRPSGGASLHAKVLVVDRRIALVGSANITGWALERNFECGTLVRGGPQPRAIFEHVEALLRAGVLIRV